MGTRCDVPLTQRNIEMTRRYTIHTDTDGEVVLLTDNNFIKNVLGVDEREGPISLRYWVRNGATDGYVRNVTERCPGTLGQQVCVGMRFGGVTLTATRQTLVGVIRREVRRAICAEIRYQKFVYGDIER